MKSRTTVTRLRLKTENDLPRRGEAGHLSAALAHPANIVIRLARTLKFDRAKKQFIGDDEANKLVCRIYREGHRAVLKGV